MEFIGTEFPKGRNEAEAMWISLARLGGGGWGEQSLDECRAQVAPDFLVGTVPLAVLRIGLRGGWT